MLQHLTRLLLCLSFSVAFCAPPLCAQFAFRARLSADQVVPWRSGNELAFGSFFLDPLSGALQARVDAPFGTPPGSFARIRKGAPGVLPTGTVLTLPSVTAYHFAADLPQPTPSDIAELRAGLWHIELMPPPSISNEPLLRGAIHDGADSFYFSGNGAQALPPTASTGRFSGSFGFTPDGRATYTIFAQASSPVLRATIRIGDRNLESTPDLLVLAPTFGGNNALFLGSTAPLSEATRARFQCSRVWMTIVTQNHPDTSTQLGGELRGTMRATAIEYGTGVGANGHPPHIINTFPWTPGGLLLIDIDHIPTGSTFNAGIFCVGTAPLHLPLPNFGDLWVNPVEMVTMALPTSGIIQGSVPVGVEAGLWVYMQFIGVGAAAEFYISPGLAVQTVW